MLERLEARFAAEGGLGTRRVHHGAAALVNHGTEQPVVRPVMRVIADPCDARRGFLDLLRQRDDPFPGVGHMLRVAASLLDELRVEVHDRQRSIDGQSVELALDLPEIDHALGIVRVPPGGGLRLEHRSELQDLAAPRERARQLLQ